MSFLDKLKAFPKKVYKLAKNNLTEVALVATSGTACGFLFDSRWMVLAGVAVASAVVFVAKKAKDGDLDKLVDKLGLDEVKKELDKLGK